MDRITENCLTNRLDPSAIRNEFSLYPNFKLTAASFDAEHLYKFSQNEFCDYPIYKKSPNIARFQPVKYSLQPRIRQSFYFVTKEERGQYHASSYNMSNDPPIINSINPSKCIDQFDKKSIFIGAIDQLNKMTLTPIKPYNNNLKSYKLQKKEFDDYNETLNKRKEYLKYKGFLNKRKVLIQNIWKNGILGVDSILDPETIFFKDQRKKMLEDIARKNEINSKNRENVIKRQQSSQDFEFSNSSFVYPPKIFDSKTDKYNFSPIMKHRGKSFVRPLNTHERLFVFDSPQISKDRTLNIIKNETKGRKYSVITGTLNKF